MTTGIPVRPLYGAAAVATAVGLTTVCFLKRNAKKREVWLLERPESFDLKIPSGFFVGKHRTNRKQATCHTQGLAITRSDIVITCCLFDRRNESKKAQTAQSFLLKGSLEAVLSRDRKRDPRWQLWETTDAPPSGGSQKTSPLPLGHPSGAASDPSTGNVIFANSTYQGSGYSLFRFFDPTTASLSHYLMIPQPVAAVAPMLGRFLVGPSWGRGRFFVIDRQHQRWRQTFLKMSEPVEQVEYNECEPWDERTVLCTGVFTGKGRADLIEIRGDRFASLEFRLRGHFAFREKSGGVTRDLGTRFYLPGSNNRYGNYKSQKPLTYEGLALDRESDSLYFLPDDVPKAKLLRYHFRQPK